jgi:hypothetical protein
LGKEDILIALRAFLDSSGKLEDDWLTLAAVAANDEMWGELESVWDKILKDHTPKGEYIHMREVYRLIKGFDSTKGWNHDNAFGLVNKCLIYLSHLPKAKIKMFYCKVDLRAWRKLRAQTYQMPDPIEMCNQFCSEVVLGWYLFHYPEMINLQTDKVKYFFDRNEYFYQPFFDKWKREKNMAEENGAWNVWNIIDQVAPAEMKTTPGIQAADIIAWGMNRETFAKEGDMAKHLGHILRSVIPAFHVVWDEAKMKEHYKPLLYLPYQD